MAYRLFDAIALTNADLLSIWTIKNKASESWIQESAFEYVVRKISTILLKLKYAKYINKWMIKRNSKTRLLWLLQYVSWVATGDI